jgi:ParB family chromosome partitioning protein
MATAVSKITLSPSRDIPFNKLILSQANVRHVKAGVSIEELAEDIAQRTLLHGLSVRAVVDADGQETGMFEIPAGGRRFRALELLVKQKRLAKTALVPCVVRDSGFAEEDSLAENIQRVPLHPLDQFRTFSALRLKGLGDDEIAARFFVTPTVVKQRLRLAAVSPKLLDAYAEDGMTLEQLMAFTVTSDHSRQEQVWDTLSRFSYAKEPYQIRRQLTETTVRASDRRAQFVTLDAYEAAGGVIMRDLFQHDDGGWLQDATLLDQLVAEKLQAEAEMLRAEGWKWIEAATDFPYGHTSRLHRINGETIALTEEEQTTLATLVAERDAIDEQYAESPDVPQEVHERLAIVEDAIAALELPPLRYEPTDIARAGAFVTIDVEGGLRIDRGFLRPEDEAPIAPAPNPDGEEPDAAPSARATQPTVVTIGGTSVAPGGDTPEENDVIRPLSERLLSELTAHRTLALRDALANNPDVALIAVLHALCLKAFYRYVFNTCLEITAKNSGFQVQAPGLSESPPATAITRRHDQWETQLPEQPSELWGFLLQLDGDSQAALFAHCASLTVNVVKDQWNVSQGAHDHGNELAQALDLDMVAAGWTPKVDNYLGRVPKPRILDAVREAKGEAAAKLIDHLKKGDMAKEAERMLEGTGWLPEVLRLPEATPVPEIASDDPEALPDFLAGDDETLPDIDAGHLAAAE